MCRGPDDFVLKIVARNTAHENELTERLTAAPNVATVRTVQVIRNAKSEPGIPIDRSLIRGFLAGLGADGRYRRTTLRRKFAAVKAFVGFLIALAWGILQIGAS